MFVPSRAKQHDTADLIHMMDVAGADRTILGSDLGLTQAPKPVDGYRMIVSDLLDHNVPKETIRQIISTNASKLLDHTLSGALKPWHLHAKSSSPVL